MSDDPIDHELFIFQLPLWTIIDTAKFHAVGVPACITILKDDGGVGSFLPIFTDSNTADALIEKLGFTNRTTLEFRSWSEVRRVAVAFQDRGFNHVGIDVSRIGSRFNGRWPSVSKLLQDIAARTDPV